MTATALCEICTRYPCGFGRGACDCTRASYKIPDSESVIWEGERTTWGHLSGNERMCCGRNLDGVLEGGNPF